MNWNPPRISNIPEMTRIILSIFSSASGREISDAPIFSKYSPSKVKITKTKFDLNLILILGFMATDI